MDKFDYYGAHGLPGRIFLDTSVVNLLLNHWDYLVENEDLPEGLAPSVLETANAMHGIYTTGHLAFWKFTVSERVWKEVAATNDSVRRSKLEGWLAELWEYQGGGCRRQVLTRARVTEIRRSVSVLPDHVDRELIIDAVRYGCDAFCTNDRRTILRHRGLLKECPLEIMSPVEWWKKIEPLAEIWR